MANFMAIFAKTFYPPCLIGFPWERRIRALNNLKMPTKQSSNRDTVMSNEKLSLSELKERGQTLGYSKIQRKHTSAKVPLASWNGFATESGSAFDHVDVYYVLARIK
jgi:hypothetical protein